MSVELMTPNDALAVAVERCTMTGEAWCVLNSDKELVWFVEPDTKVDEDDLTFPAIVHMRGGTLATDSIAILAPGTVAS